MNPQERRQIGSPDTNQQFIEYIPSLVQQSVLGRPDKSRRAQKELIAGLIAHEYYDPVFFAFEQIQRCLLEAKDPGTMTTAVNFFGKLLLDVNSSVVAEGGAKILRITPQVLKIIDRMQEHDGKLQKNTYLQTLLPNNYRSALTLAASAKIAHEQGQNAIEIHIATPPQSESERSKREEEMWQFNTWVNSIKRLTFMTEEGILFPEQRDAFIDAMKAEPAMTVMPREKLYTRKVNGFSLQDIEELPYPPSAEDTAKITEYLAAMLSEKISNTDRSLIDEIFFGLTMFFDNEDSRQVTYRNHHFLSIINHWQETFVRQLLSQQDSQTEARIQGILKNLSRFGEVMMMEGMRQWTAYPLVHDPQHIVGKDDEDIRRHLLLAQAVNHYRETHPDTTFLYTDEVGLHYFAETILPQFERRLTHFGVLEKFKEPITVIRRGLQTRPFSERHLEALREIFGRNCGQEFLDKLNKHAVDIEQVTKGVWQKTFEEGIHFLPMQEGVNLIEFSENSVPDILGLVSFSINMSGSLQDWQINVAFQLRNTSIRIMGKLDQNGKLTLTAPLEREIPGLYTILNHIAVLTFHDLVVQEQGERKGEREARQHGLKIAPTPIKSSEEQIPGGRVRSYRGSLPRKQSDTTLVSDVYRATGFKPRRVEIHPTYLKFAKEYEAAVQLYNEALETHATEQNLGWLRDELEEARKRAYRISEPKKSSIPARFKLKTVQDPITGEERFLETWVVEHTSPRPTDEELQSPVKLFERYYRHSSALASLDQMKHWFIGQ